MCESSRAGWRCISHNSCYLVSNATLVLLRHPIHSPWMDRCPGAHGCARGTIAGGLRAQGSRFEYRSLCAQNSLDINQALPRFEIMRPHFTHPVDKIEKSDCETLIRLALAEDAPAGDPTSEDIFSADRTGGATIVAREPGVLCGITLVGYLIEIFAEITGERISIITSGADGESFERGGVLLKLHGPIAALLRIERIMLNFLQYLCGIATVTADAVRHAPPGVFILDTRKTLPGYRKLAKYAVYTGGGTNHRIHLSEMALIKDNHIAAAGSIAAAARRIREKHPGLPYEIEVDQIAQIPAALAEKPKILLLDNMDVRRIREAVGVILSETKKMGTSPPVIEVSGGWTPSRLPELVNIGLPVGVSMGFLTHTTRFLDLSLEMQSS